MAGDADLIPPVQTGQGPASQSGYQRAPDYRQVQQPTEMLQPWHLPDNGAASKAEELSNVFKEFEDISTDWGVKIGSKLAEQAGQKAGAAAGAAGNGTPVSGLAAITPYAQSYNAAVHSTYITQSQLDLEKQLSTIEGQNIGDPDGFQGQAASAVQGALKPMDPIYQPEIKQWAQARIQAGVNRQNEQKATDVKNQAITTYQTATPDLITAALHTAGALPGEQGDAVITKLISDDQVRLSALVASRSITPEQANTLHQKMVNDTNNQLTGQKVDLSLQPVLQMMRANVEAADKLIIQPDPNLTPEQNQVRRQEYEKDRQEYVQAQTRARVNDLAAVHQSLEAGSYGATVEGALHGLYKGGALSEEGLFSGLAQSLRNQRAGLEDEASLQMVDAAVHGTGPKLDPKDPAAQAAADKYFQTHVAMSGNVSDPQYAIGAAEFFRQTNILPKTVQSQIRVGLLSGDPTSAARAAALASKIQGVNPEADVFVSNPRLASIASLLNDNIRAGLPPAKAYQMAQTATEITPEQRKIRDQRYAADLKTAGGNQAALQSIVNSQDGGYFTHAPQPPIAMQAAFDGLTRQFYDQTGDIAKARSLAGEQLRMTWGVTKVNGAPEYAQYPVSDAQVPTVRADIASSAQGAGYTGDPSQIHLTPNANTTASSGRVWSLTHVDPTTGAADVLLGNNNRPLTYTLPTSQDFAKAHDALVAQKLDQARAGRDRERQNATDQSALEKQLSDYYLNPANRRGMER